MSRPRLALALFTALILAPCTAPLAQERGAPALGELIAGLGVSARVLVIGAHPDDEDTQLITWLARGRHVETAYLSLTRGDGGQNLIGNELGEALGVIRTEELFAARRIDGAHQFFTRAYDFGFSKSAEETFRHWPHDSLLRDVVTVVRWFQPHVIVSIFSGTPRDGHGQHQVAGILAREAYDAAGDSLRFPAATTQGYRPWTPLKFYRSARFAREAGTLIFNVGELDPLRGQTYAQIAAESRSQHKSQANGTAQRNGPMMDYLRREATRVNQGTEPKAEHSLFDGIDTTWTRLTPRVSGRSQRAALAALPAAIADVRKSANLWEPRVMVASLVRVYQILDALAYPVTPTMDPDVLRSAGDARERVARAIAMAAGVSVEALADREVDALGDTVGVQLAVYDNGHTAVTVQRAILTSPDFETQPLVSGPVEVAPDTFATWRGVMTARRVTEPWWLSAPRVGDLFGTLPNSPAVYERTQTGRAFVRLAVGGVGIDAVAPVVYRDVDPVRGDVRRPLAAVPAVAVALDRAVEFAPANTPLDRTVNVHLRSGSTAPRDVRVTLRLPPGLTTDSVARTVRLSSLGTVRTATFRIVGRLAPGSHEIVALAESAGETFTSGYTTIDYAHITPQRLYHPASARVEAVDVKLPAHLTVAYIPGVGDNVAPTLQQLGVSLTMLDPAALATADLTRFTTIVVGPRAYEASADLVANNARLLDWVRTGGTLVVQYGQYEMARPGIMPYPITLARPADRVTDETAPVQILAPDHPVLTTPNRITEHDFDGWVQDRSQYMPRTFAPEYHALLSMNDPGEPPNQGALLIAPYGRGTYVYTTLALFRQLPSGIPGAARLFVNLLGASASAGSPTKAMQ